jgi:SAM-dependent methyltransferase
MAEDMDMQNIAAHGQPPAGSPGFDEYVETRRAFFDALAPRREMWRRRNLGYYRQIERQYRLIVPKGARVLEIGCATGHLLAALEPSCGVGVDISPAMIDQARREFPQDNLHFEPAPIEKWDPSGQTFDYIILSDVLGLLRDIELVFHLLRACCHSRTRLIMNFHSQLWMPVYSLAEKLRAKAPNPLLNWVTREDVTNMLELAGFEVIRTFSRILLPIQLPLLGLVLNRFISRLWPFRWFCISNFVLARLPMRPFEQPPRVSVVCACRNEAGHIEEIVERLPQMGAGTELILVEGGSSDDTYEKCLQVQKGRPEVNIQVHRQTGKGKGDAVRLGFAKATGDVLMILDADMTVPPEDLPRFYEALIKGRVEFVNGSRMVYPMKKQAMRFLNLCGNKFFAMAFSFLLEQTLKDTLCGTKVLTRSDYQRLAEGRSYFGDFDPFGDFDLIFGAAKMNLKIRDLPITYHERKYGQTNISRWRHGWLLLKMALFAALRLKFI